MGRPQIGKGNQDTLGLDDDAFLSAFEIDRAPRCTVGSFVGKDGECRFAFLLFFDLFRELALFLFDFLADLCQALIGVLLFGFVQVCSRINGLCFFSQLLHFLIHASDVVLDIGKFATAAFDFLLDLFSTCLQLVRHGLHDVRRLLGLFQPLGDLAFHKSLGRCARVDYGNDQNQYQGTDGTQ